MPGLDERCELPRQQCQRRGRQPRALQRRRRATVPHRRPSASARRRAGDRAPRGDLSASSESLPQPAVRVDGFEAERAQSLKPDASLLARDAHQFRERRAAVGDQRAPSRAQRAACRRARRRRAAPSRRRRRGSAAQRLVDPQQLVDAGAAAESGLIACAHPGAPPDRLIGRQARARRAAGPRRRSARARAGTAGHSVRTSRCASTPSRLDASRYGSTPMSASRVTALAASLVCSVASTRWPVSDACTAICAVSRSRISPIMMTSGSWRRIERSARANVSSMRALTCVCATPSSAYSIGSSTVIMFVVPRGSRDSAGVERRRLARAGRAR